MLFSRKETSSPLAKITKPIDGWCSFIKVKIELPVVNTSSTTRVGPSPEAYLFKH